MTSDVVRHTTTYSRRGRPHRLDGPAQVNRRSESGPKYSEEWWIDGRISRADGPAVTKFTARGEVEVQTYYRDGQIHRIGSPAEISYGRNSGKVEGESWYEDDVYHRLDGPAWVLHENQRGYEPRVEWWIRGEQYGQDEHARIVEALGSGAPLEWAIAYGTGSDS